MINYRFKCLVNGSFTNTCEIRKSEIEFTTYSTTVYIVGEDSVTGAITAVTNVTSIDVHNTFLIDNPKLDPTSLRLVDTGTSIGTTSAVTLTVRYGVDLPVNSQIAKIYVGGVMYEAGDSFTVKYADSYFGLFEYDPINNWYISANEVTKIGVSKLLYVLKVSEDLSENYKYSPYVDNIVSINNDSAGEVITSAVSSLVDMPDPLNSNKKTRAISVGTGTAVTKNVKISVKTTTSVTSNYTLLYNNNITYGLYHVIDNNDPVSSSRITGVNSSITLYFLTRTVTPSGYVQYDAYTQGSNPPTVESVTTIPPGGEYPYTISGVGISPSVLYKGIQVPHVVVTDTSGVTRDFTLRPKINNIAVNDFILKPSSNTVSEETKLKNASRIYGCPFTNVDAYGVPIFNKKDAIRIDSFAKQQPNFIQNNTFKYCILYDWSFEGVEFTNVYTNTDITESSNTLQKVAGKYYFTYTTSTTSLPKTLSVDFKLPKFLANKPELFRIINGVSSLPQTIQLVTQEDADKVYPTSVSSTSLKTKIKDVAGNYTTFTHRDLVNGSVTIPESHDCISTYNDMSKQYRSFTEIYQESSNINNKYAYTIYNDGTTDHAIYGGEGKNISYRFIIADLQEYKLSKGLNTNNNNTLVLGTWVANITQRGEYVNKRYISNPTTDHAKGYTNTLFNSNFKSLQRDEVYRYGIVFYNKYGIYSPVKWIGDIRTPGISEPGFNTFLNNVSASFNPLGSNNDDGLAIRPIGIEFLVKNMPEEAVGYEIVRCKRSDGDRSILTQGVLSVVMERPESTYTNNTRQLSPSSVLTIHNFSEIGCSYWGSRYTGDTSTLSRATYSVPKYYTLHSPEISYLKDTYKDILKGGDVYLCPEMVVWNSELISNNKREDTYLVNSKKILDNQNLLTIPAFDILVGTNESPTYPNEFKKNAPDLDMNYEVAGTNGQLYNFIDYTDKNQTDPRIVEFNSKYDLVSLGFRYCGASIAMMYNQSAKYRNTSSSSTAGKYVSSIKYRIDDIEFALEPSWADYEKREDFLSGINGKRFNNWCRQAYMRSKLDENDNKTWQSPGGRCAVIYCNEASPVDILHGEFLVSDKFKYTPAAINPSEFRNNILRNVVSVGGDEENLWARTGTVLVNIKKNIIPYGGDSYANRNLSKYISVGSYHTKVDVNTYKPEFNGDVFITTFNFAKTHKFYTKEDIQMYSGMTAYSVPIESSINTSLASSKLFSPQVDYSYTFNYNHQIEPSDVSGYFTQKKPLYSYNTIYSTENYVKIMTSSSEYDEYNKKLDCRTHYSNLKSNDELIDSWTKFQPINYIDVDSKHGSITNIRTFNNELLFWQKNAFGKFSVNDRSLITDDTNNGLILGTGGILSRYDYIATTNGMHKNDSDTQSDNLLYWFDYDKQELCTYSGGNLACISKLKNVQAYINKQNKQNINPSLVYDKKYNELLSCLNGTESVVFNEYAGVFTGIYDISFKDTIEFSNGLMMFTDKAVLSSYNAVSNNAGTYTHVNTLNVPITPSVKYIVNDIYAGIKVFDNVEFSACEYDVTKNKSKINIDNINYNFNTDLMPTVTKATGSTDITSRELSYRLAIPRVEYSSVGNRYRGRVLYCDFISSNSNKSIELSYVATKYRISRS